MSGCVNSKNRLVPRRTCSTSPSVEQSSEDAWRRPLEQQRRSVVAIGKFDALHTGHRSLAVQASGEGRPWLLSFWGMAEVLGWPKRLPLVAPMDRGRILSSWAPLCQGHAPCMRLVPFAALCNMSPEDFVSTLANDFQVSGVVVGAGFRFGHKAVGDTVALCKLGTQMGLRVQIAELVGADSPGQTVKVSSSAVREALAAGDMPAVHRSLDRRHRVIALVPPMGLQARGSGTWIPFQQLQNQPPCAGKYTAMVSLHECNSDFELTELPMRTRKDVTVIVHLDALQLDLVDDLSRSPSMAICIDF